MTLGDVYGYADAGGWDWAGDQSECEGYFSGCKGMSQGVRGVCEMKGWVKGWLEGGCGLLDRVDGRRRLFGSRLMLRLF